MSKTCCGNTYSDDQKFCAVCGKPLAATDDSDSTTVLISEDVYAKAQAQREQQAQGFAPQGQPTGMPPVQPMGAPQGQPMGMPPVQPMGMPQGQPMGMPQGQPMGMPPVQPKAPKSEADKAKTAKVIGLSTMGVAIAGLIAVLVLSILFVIAPKTKAFKGAADDGLKIASSSDYSSDMDDEGSDSDAEDNAEDSAEESAAEGEE